MKHPALLLLTAALWLNGCAAHRSGNPTAPIETQPSAVAIPLEEPLALLEPVLPSVEIRWHLLRAQEQQACSLFTAAQAELDNALHLLDALEEADLEETDTRVEELRSDIEQAYFALLPHIDRLSPDSPLTVLLNSLSKEQLDAMPPDAGQMARFHKLSQRCQIPIDSNAAVMASIRFFQEKGRRTYATWLKRAGRYRPLILKTLAKEQVPAELLYIAMIESGFNPHAHSRARAAGLWQFVASTARIEGLNKTHWIDERYDPVKATKAAAAHLKRLYGEFGDWRLAIAAYNAGRGRVARAVAKAGSKDVWKLDLPRETRNYLPLFMAAVLIGQDPTLFGFTSTKAEPALAFDAVKLPYPINLRAAAQASGLTYDQLRDLNPEILQYITPPHHQAPYILRVPPGKGKHFLKRYAKLPEEERLAWHHYQVRPGESLSTIAHAFGLSPRLVAEANQLDNPNRIKQGQKLYIPAAIGRSSSSFKAPALTDTITYVVRPGDTLYHIARNFGVNTSQLMRWNKTNALIRPGDTLTLYPQPGAKRKRPPAPVPASGMHIVQTQDTLWDIARKFGITIENLKQWNNLSDEVIRPGQQLALGPPGPKATYTVVKGDTLFSIARKFGLAVEDIARHNNLSATTTLLIGTVLNIGTLGQAK